MDWPAALRRTCRMASSFFHPLRMPRLCSHRYSAWNPTDTRSEVTRVHAQPGVDILLLFAIDARTELGRAGCTTGGRGYVATEHFVDADGARPVRAGGGGKGRDNPQLPR